MVVSSREASTMVVKGDVASAVEIVSAQVVPPKPEMSFLKFSIVIKAGYHLKMSKQTED